MLAINCVGICGSDVHYLTKGRIGDFVLTAPMVIGHEAAGTVVQCGSKVHHLKPGDRCAIEPGVPCYRCQDCKTGHYNLCSQMKFCATPPHHGNLVQFYKHPADFCYKLPDHVSLEEGALLEPLSVGIHACRRGGVGLGSVVLILGAGPIGLVTLLAAKSMGAAQILIVDIQQNRLDVAQELGANFTLLMNKNDGEEQLHLVAQKIEKMLGGRKADIAIECCGAETTTRLSIFVRNSPQIWLFLTLKKRFLFKSLLYRLLVLADAA